jgi:hypothetical protein
MGPPAVFHFGLMRWAIRCVQPILLRDHILLSGSRDLHSNAKNVNACNHVNGRCPGSRDMKNERDPIIRLSFFGMYYESSSF